MTKTPKKAPAKKPAKKSAKPKSAGKKAEAERPGKSQTAEQLAAAVDGLMNPVVVPGPSVDLVNGFKSTTRDQLKALVKGFDTLKRDAKRNSEAIATMLTKASENKHLDKPAWRALLVLRKLNPRSLTFLMKYADDLELWESAAVQLEMFKDEPVVDDEVDAEGERQAELAVSPAKEAASGLVPSRRPQMQIVPKADAPDAA